MCLFQLRDQRLTVPVDCPATAAGWQNETVSLLRRGAFPCARNRSLPLDGAGNPDASRIPALVTEIAEQKAGLIYLPPDVVMNENRALLAQSAFDAGIPVFSASEGAVRSGGALFAYVHRYYTVGLAAGNKAARILQNGVPAFDIPIDTPHRGLFVVNMTAARRLGVYPPAALVQGADLIDVPTD